MILNALGGKSLPIYGDGKQIRDWLYVEDHCRAIWTVIQNGKPGEIYNVGGDNQYTNLEIVRMICKILDEIYPESDHYPHGRLIEHVKDRPGHDRRYAMNINKISAELGWQPKIGLEQGIMETVNWYINHPEWVAKVMEQVNYHDWVRKNYQKRD
jgi:dTDP-glucose 4,6-dehydratase